MGGRSCTTTTTTTVAVVLALGSAIVALSAYNIDITYTPRGLINSKEILPLFFSPLSSPSTLLDFSSRLIQVGLILTTKPTFTFLAIFSVSVNLVRAGIGFVLTRSVGWAYPFLFSHWALYERTSGLGHVLVGWTFVHGSPEGWTSGWAIGPIIAGLCLLDNSPWTYSTAIVLALSYRLGQVLSERSNGYLPLSNLSPRSSISSTTDEKTAIASSPPPLKYVFLGSLVFVPYFFVPPLRFPMPQNTSLDIVILSYPRPIGLDVSVSMINQTITSFYPYLDTANKAPNTTSTPSTSLSLFTHSTDHPAFDALSKSYPHLDFYTDNDTHPNDFSGHYLHLAETFRWVEERKIGEWIMLVEDDFPLCKGRWDVVESVMYRLEEKKAEGEISAGFIGTGGSGLIIHRSYLPLLSLLLRTHSASPSPLPPSIRHRAPDQIIQDCILGRPRSLCERKTKNAKAVISSRLVLDHIGGMATTTQGKALNGDKWRCGWRHAFHGDGQVEVVVV